MDKAVLLITFNRPQYTQIVLNALKAIGIKNLYIFKDGPRPYNNKDIIASQEIEKIINNINWVQNLHTNFMNNNLGCGWGPYSAISWAFQYEEELIILEDDCVPTEAFFHYCSYLLDKYRNSEKVRYISGRSIFMEHPIFQKYDYIFTQYAPTLGWATWKKVWNNFNLQENYSIIPFFKSGGFKEQFSSKIEAIYANSLYYNRKAPLKEVLHSWDYQFLIFSSMHGALAIIPSHNLIKYIGYEGTHETADFHYQLEVTEDYLINKEPSRIEIIPCYEQDYFKKFKHQSYRYWIKSILNYIKFKIIGRADFT